MLERYKESANGIEVARSPEGTVNCFCDGSSAGFLEESDIGSSFFFLSRVSTCSMQIHGKFPTRRPLEVQVYVRSRASSSLTYPLFGPLFLRTSSYVQLWLNLLHVAHAGLAPSHLNFLLLHRTHAILFGRACASVSGGFVLLSLAPLALSPDSEPFCAEISSKECRERSMKYAPSGERDRDDGMVIVDQQNRSASSRKFNSWLRNAGAVSCRLNGPLVYFQGSSRKLSGWVCSRLNRCTRSTVFDNGGISEEVSPSLTIGESGTSEKRK